MKIPKPPADETRSARVVMRVRPDEHEAWTKAAKRHGFASLSAWLRALATEAAKVRRR